MVLIVAMIAMVLTMALLPPLSQLAHRTGLLAYPAARKVHEGAIPQIGGIAFSLCALVGASWLMPPSHAYIGYLVGAAAAFALGLYDDYRELGYGSKFVVQFAGAALAIAIAGISTIDLGEPFGALASWLAVPVALAFLVGTTNAVNHADGLDGLAGGLTLVSCLALSICALQGENDFALIVPLVIAGGVIGFLRFNTHPAQIFMGNGGAYFLGFSLGFAALVLSNAPTGPNFVTAVMLLGVPVIDTAFIPIYRYAHGRNLFASDRSHLHHRLLEAGFSHRSSVALIYAVHGALVLTGWSLRNGSGIVRICAFATLAFAIESAPVLLAPLRRALRMQLVALRPSAWLGRGLCLAAFVAMLTSTVVAVASAPSVTIDFFVCALLALAMVFAWERVRGDRGLSWPARCGLYVLGAYTVYFQSQETETFGVSWNTAAFGVVALFLVFRLVTGRSRAFALTTLDLLVVLSMIAVAVVGRDVFSASTVDVVKLVVWFYGVELLADDQEHGNWLRGLTYCGFGVIAARGAMELLV